MRWWLFCIERSSVIMLCKVTRDVLHLRVIGGSGPKRLLLEEMIERAPLSAFESRSNHT